MGSAGQLPKGFPEGMITGLTKIEFDSLQNNPILKECFEAIEIVPEYPKEELPLQTDKT